MTPTWVVAYDVGFCYLAIAIVLLVAGLDDNAARRRRGRPEYRMRVVVLAAALWLPVILAAVISVAWDAAAAVCRR